MKTYFRNIRGAVDPVTIILMVGVAAFLGGGLKLPAFLQKKPPVAQLSAAEIELAKVKAAQQKAEAELAAARAQEAARTSSQLDYAQQFASGTSLALAKIPVEEQTPEIKLASEMALRANLGLEAARGKLPAEAQAEIKAMVDQALSAVTAERDAYRAALVKKDAELQSASQAKAAIEKQIPVLEAKLQTKSAEVAAVEAKTQTLTQEVKVWAQGKADAEAKAGSLDAYAGRLVRGIIIAGVLYLFLHFLLPNIAQSYPGVSWLTHLADGVKNLTTGHE